MTATTTIPLRSRPAWQALEQHYAEVQRVHLRDLFARDPSRGERLVADGAGLYLDYSKNRITDETLRLLLQLAEECGLRERTEAMFRGEHINITEDRAVLHVALRMPKGESLVVDGADVVAEVHEVLDRMAAFSDRVRSGEWKGHTGKPIRNVVNIGIGGSDLGPVMAYEALRHYAERELTFRFVSNVDSTDFVEATRDLDAEETLFIVSSKTFTTLETMTNAQLGARVGAGRARRRVGGRQALRRGLDERREGVPSSASTPTTCSGSGTGSAAATRWTRRSASRRCSPSAPTASARCSPASTRWTSTSATAPFERNLPVLMGLLAVWYGDFFGAETVGRDALRAVPEAVPRLPPAADDGVERQARDARRTARRLRDRRRLLGRARHQRPAQLLPADPPGDEADPGRPDRVRQDAEPDPRPPRPADVERVRAGRGAGVRQDRGGGPRGGHAARPSSRTACSRATGRRT